jgi:hypothetical protein
MSAPAASRSTPFTRTRAWYTIVSSWARTPSTARTAGSSANVVAEQRFDLCASHRDAIQSDHDSVVRVVLEKALEVARFDRLRLPPEELEELGLRHAAIPPSSGRGIRRSAARAHERQHALPGVGRGLSMLVRLPVEEAVRSVGVDVEVVFDAGLG